MLLDRLDQRRLLAADIAAGALEGLELEGLAGPQDVGPDDPERPGSLDLGLDGVDLVEVFVPDVDVPAARPDHHRAEDHPLDDEMGSAEQHLAVLEGGRLALVGVADDIGHIGALGLVPDLAPLGEGGPAGPPMPRRSDVLS